MVCQKALSVQEIRQTAHVPLLQREQESSLLPKSVAPCRRRHLKPIHCGSDELFLKANEAILRNKNHGNNCHNCFYHRLAIKLWNSVQGYDIERSKFPFKLFRTFSAELRLKLLTTSEHLLQKSRQVKHFIATVISSLGHYVAQNLQDFKK